YRGTSPGGEGATPYVSGITAVTFIDTVVTNGTTYYYKVTAMNANSSIVPAIPSESAPSTEISAKPRGKPNRGGAGKLTAGRRTISAGAFLARGKVRVR